MNIVIDGQEIRCEAEQTILEVAREKGIYIPSLCDHLRLTPFSGCRLCIVEILGRKGYSPSCSTCVEEGMEVKTKTRGLQKLRREILELILSEHPNACLICSEKDNCDEYKSTIRKVGEATGCVLCSNNGRCELQEVVGALKIDKVRFPSVYRNFEVKKGDPFFDRNYNLCILCARCVRVCHEVRGASTVSFVFRGSESVIGTILDKTLLDSGCQFCGACVDVCPTGALTERALKYETLPDKETTTICPLCSMGCELEIKLKDGRILSSQPSEAGVVNQGQACVKGRFLIKDLVYSPKRIHKPLIRVNKELEEVGWEEALGFVAQRLKKFKGKDIGLISSPQASCEESFLFRKFAREALKTENSDSTAHFSPLATYMEMARVNGLKPDINFRIKDISKAKVLFLVGSEIAVSHPMIWLEVLKAVRAGAKLVVASSMESFLNRHSSLYLRIKPGSEFYLFSFLCKAFLEKEQEQDASKSDSFEPFKKSLEELHSSQVFEFTGVREEDLKEASEFLFREESSIFLFGSGMTQSPFGSQSVSALWNLASLTGARLFPLGLENNLRGEFEIGEKFSRKGLTFDQIIGAASSGEIKALYLAGPVPELKKAKMEFLVLQDSFKSENIKMADAVLPAATFAETDGTFINNEGRIQKFGRVIKPVGEAKPDWWIISRLAQKMEKKGFDFRTPSGIMEEMRKASPSFLNVSYPEQHKDKAAFIGEEENKEKKFLPLTFGRFSVETSKAYPFLLCVEYNLDFYRNLSLSQEIRGLKILRDSRWIKMNSEDAERLKLKEGETVVVESLSGKINSVVKISGLIPRGMAAASLLWNEEADFSVFNLFSPTPQGVHFSNVLPVKIKRGK